MDSIDKTQTKNLVRGWPWAVEEGLLLLQPRVDLCLAGRRRVRGRTPPKPLRMEKHDQKSCREKKEYLRWLSYNDREMEFQQLHFESV